MKFFSVFTLSVFFANSLFSAFPAFAADDSNFGTCESKCEPIRQKILNSGASGAVTQGPPVPTQLEEYCTAFLGIDPYGFDPKSAQGPIAYDKAMIGLEAISNGICWAACFASGTPAAAVLDPLCSASDLSIGVGDLMYAGLQIQNPAGDYLRKMIQENVGDYNYGADTPDNLDSAGTGATIGSMVAGLSADAAKKLIKKSAMEAAKKEAAEKALTCGTAALGTINLALRGLNIKIMSDILDESCNVIQTLNLSKFDRQLQLFSSCLMISNAYADEPSRFNFSKLNAKLDSYGQCLKSSGDDSTCANLNKIPAPTNLLPADAYEGKLFSNSLGLKNSLNYSQTANLGQISEVAVQQSVSAAMRLAVPELSANNAPSIDRLVALIQADPAPWRALKGFESTKHSETLLAKFQNAGKITNAQPTATPGPIPTSGPSSEKSGRLAGLAMTQRLAPAPAPNSVSTTSADSSIFGMISERLRKDLDRVTKRDWSTPLNRALQR